MLMSFVFAAYSNASIVHEALKGVDRSLIFKSRAGAMWSRGLASAKSGNMANNAKTDNAIREKLRVLRYKLDPRTALSIIRAIGMLDRVR